MGLPIGVMNRGVRLLGVFDFALAISVCSETLGGSERSGARAKDGEWYCKGGAATGGGGTVAGLGVEEVLISSTPSAIFKKNV